MNNPDFPGDWSQIEHEIAALGPELLDDVHAFLGRFVAFPSPETHDAATLWAAHAHGMEAWDTTARLAFLSPEPGSGKTRALEIIGLLVPRPIEAVNMSPSALFRLIGREEGLPTILFDEIDTVFGPKAREQEELRGLLNAGYHRGAKTYRGIIRGGKVGVEEIEAFAAVALAGLNDLPDTLMSRAIIVRMRRRAPKERVEPYRRRLHSAEGEVLRDRLAAWIEGQLPGLKTNFPELPASITDRAADCWEPLIAIADIAGGHWPDRARVAAVTDVTASAGGRETLGVRLLRDLKEIFGEEDHLPTERILSKLHDMDESPWGDIRGKPLDARGLARRLSNYGIKRATIRVLATTHKGYRASDLHDSWARYLPKSPAPPLSPQEGVTSVTTGTTFPTDVPKAAWFSDTE
jgi:hypothetical protein